MVQQGYMRMYMHLLTKIHLTAASGSASILMTLLCKSISTYIGQWLINSVCRMHHQRVFTIQQVINSIMGNGK